MAYDYLQAVRDDIAQEAEDDADRVIEMYRDTEGGPRFEDDLTDWLRDTDITGNLSGGHTFNSYKSQQYVNDNMDLLHEAIDDDYVSEETVGRWFLDGNWEAMDVTIREYVLPQAVHEWTVDGGLEDLLEDHAPQTPDAAGPAAHGADMQGAGI